LITEIELFEKPDIIPLDFCLRDWLKNQVYKRQADTRDKLLCRILDSAARIKKREDRLRRTTRDLRTRTANFIETGGGVFEHLL